MDLKNVDSLLGRFYTIAQIFAFIGTPIVVAIVGWKAQASAVEVSISKDYVQLAMQVLREPLHEDRNAAKAWAVGVIQKYSPVPFSPETGRELSKGAIELLDQHPLLKSAMSDRSPCKSINSKMLPSSLALDVEELYTQCVKNKNDLVWLKIYIQMIANENKKMENPGVSE
ncbi:MAG: hypothetical protein LCH73_03795 [Proteobacteria bacterium]|nr:hypothetical protein [Pseudomonadota bacterium]